VRQKHSSAEEPVTARIRRRTEALPASSAAIELDASASPTGTSDEVGMVQNSSTKPQMAFQERIAMERRRNDDPEKML
jgi:hypothetical protein